jgi:pilus assembly protein Flp/PilA
MPVREGLTLQAAEQLWHAKALNYLVWFVNQYRQRRWLTEIAMRRLRISPRRIRGKAVGGMAVLRLIADERGVTAIEYTLIAALIAIAVAVIIATIGTEVIAPMNTIAGKL